MSVEQHEHRAYEVWDGASGDDISRLESTITGLRQDLSMAEGRISDLGWRISDLERRISTLEG